MIKKLDHYVITSKNIEKSIEFYSILGFKVVSENNSYSLVGNNFMIKLHYETNDAKPVPKNVQIGCIDICFEADESLISIQETLAKKKIPLVMGPVQRKGFNGPMTSIYVSDPDGNLIELSSYQN